MRIYTVIIITALLTACGAWPKNHEEFIKTMGEGRESTVNVPYKTVVSRNHKLVNKCLNIDVVIYNGYGAEIGTNTFTPKIIGGEKSTTYSLQFDGTKYINTGYPEDGYYMFTGQVIKMSKTKTKIITHAIWNRDELQTTFHDWSKGTSNVCPDMT